LLPLEKALKIAEENDLDFWLEISPTVDLQFVDSLIMRSLKYEQKKKAEGD